MTQKNRPLQAAWLLKAVTCIDLTTLSGDDTPSNVHRLCMKATQPVRYDLLQSMDMHDKGSFPCCLEVFIQYCLHLLKKEKDKLHADHPESHERGINGGVILSLFTLQQLSVKYQLIRKFPVYMVPWTTNKLCASSTYNYSGQGAVSSCLSVMMPDNSHLH